MSNFRFVWCKQIELVMTIPHSDSMRDGYAKKLVREFSITMIHSMLQPSRFSKTDARTMDPAIGAPTFAFGNHRCRLYSAVFTIKAIVHANHRKILLQEVGSGWIQYSVSTKFKETVRF